MRSTSIIAVLGLLMAACGGGGDSTPAPSSPTASPSPAAPAPERATPATPATPTASATISASSLVVTADSSLLERPVDRTLTLALANTTSAKVWTRVRASSVILQNPVVEWTPPTQGKVRLTFLKPGLLGAGSYRMTVSIEVCADDRCATPLEGSPFSVEVEYRVTGGLTAHATWPTVDIPLLTLDSTQTTEARVPVAFTISNLPLNGVFVGRRSSTNGVIIGGTLQTPRFDVSGEEVWVEYTLSLRPPASLGSGVFEDSMDFVVCFDRACSQPVPGGAHTVRLRGVVLATQGGEYSVQRVAVPGGTSDLVWSGARNALYLSSGTSLAYPWTGDTRVQALNPVTATLGDPTILTRQGPGPLAVSDDGSYLYAGSTQPVVHRLQLASMTEDLTIPLGSGYNGNADIAHDLAVLDGQPQSFLASLKDSYLRIDDGIHVFDGATRRTNHTQGSTGFGNLQPRTLERGPSASTFHSLRWPYADSSGTLETLEVSPPGVEPVASFGLTLPTGARELRYGSGRLHGLDGSVRDATTGGIAGSLDCHEPALFTGECARFHDLVVDPAHRRIFAVQGDWLMSFDSETFERLALLKLPGDGSAGSALVLWGTEGLAVRRRDEVLLLSGTFFSTYDGAPTMSYAPSSPIQ